MIRIRIVLKKDGPLDYFGAHFWVVLLANELAIDSWRIELSFETTWIYFYCGQLLV